MTNVPVRFKGTREQALANYRTHDFTYDDDGGRCGSCDVRPSGAGASYPCGTIVPREEVQVRR